MTEPRIFPLLLVRDSWGAQYTEGRLYVNGVMFCYTLEDTDRRLEELPPHRAKLVKVAGQTAIPRGKYPLILSYSQRFKCLTPELVAVPHFTAIRIHPGNTHADTEGCLLVGNARGTPGRIVGGSSRPAFAKLMRTLEAASDAGYLMDITVR